MKISTNYDLIDKARQAKTGFSLKRYVGSVGSCMTLVSPLFIADAVIEGKTPLEMTARIGGLLIYYCGFFWLTQKPMSSLTKARANNELRKLSNKFKDICVDTNADLLQGVTCYKTEYSLNYDSFLPQIEEKKYLAVPVNNEWNNNNNNTRSLVQEHMVGTREFALSHGEPKQKVYTLAAMKMVHK